MHNGRVATTQIHILALSGTKDRLAVVLRHGRDERAKISRRKRWQGRNDAELGGAERARHRAALQAHLRELRHTGDLLDTIPAVVEFGAWMLLEDRGWNHDWPKLPDEARLPGRWPGSREIGLPERITVKVGAQIADRMRAACWFTSAKAIAELHAWRDTHPGKVYDQDLLDEYEELAAQVDTPGDAWRDSLECVLPLPPRPAPAPAWVLAERVLKVTES